MKKVLIVDRIDSAELKIIRDRISKSDGENIYLMLGCAQTCDLRSLDDLGFERQQLPIHGEEYRDKFLREYIDIIGSVGKENDNLEWWATDIASKNRFTSRIPELLANFLSVVEAIRGKRFGVMVIVDPDWTIVTSLQKALSRDEVYFIVSSGFARKRLLSLLHSRLRSLLSAVYNFGKVGVKAIYCRFILGDIVKRTMGGHEQYFVVKTFIYNNSFSGERGYRDTFFGKLPDIMSRDRKVLILASVLGGYRHCLEQIKKCSSFRIIPIEYLVTFSDMMSAFRAFIYFKPIVSDKHMFGCEVADIIRNELSRTWNGVQYFQLLHYWALKRLPSIASAGTFLMTYENNPWEKMCIAALRQVSPKTHIIGYQHTIVSHASANMFMSRYEYGIMPIPDKVLTVGGVTRNIMERYGSFKKDFIRTSCGLRFEYIFNIKRLARKNTGNILIGLEGIQEVYKMVEYVLKELGGNKEYKVRIRTHPVLSWDYFRKSRGFDLAKYPNFNLSAGGPLKDDLEWADVVVYWGSTIGVEALNIGRPVVHYDIGSVFNYDPLFESGDLKWVVSEDVRLAVILEKIRGLSDEEFLSSWEKAKAYLNNYFYPINEGNLTEFMKDNTEVVPSRSDPCVTVNGML